MDGGENADFELLLAEFRNRGSRFSFEMIDPDRDPVRTEENGIRRYNTLLIKSGIKSSKSPSWKSAN